MKMLRLPTLITNRALTHIFEGVTEAVKRGLDPAVRLSGSAAERKHANYLKRTKRQLEQLPPGEYRPDLARLDKLLSSLRVRGRD